MKKRNTGGVSFGWRSPGTRRHMSDGHHSGEDSAACDAAEQRECDKLRSAPSLRMVIYASDVNCMAGGVLDWGNLETGGLLYGGYTDDRTVLVMLATPSGAGAKHRPERFVPDLDQVRRDDELICKWTGLIVVGRYHSHTCGLAHPSPVDDGSRGALLRKNPRRAFIELILCPDTSDSATVRLYAYACPGDDSGGLVPCEVVVLPGYSPIRTFLRGSPAVPAEDDRDVFAGACVIIDPMLPLQVEALVDRLSAEITCLPARIAATIGVTVSDHEVVVSMDADGQDLQIRYTPKNPNRDIRIAVRDTATRAAAADAFQVSGTSTLAEITALMRSRIDNQRGQRMVDVCNESAQSSFEDEAPVCPAPPNCGRLSVTAAPTGPDTYPVPTSEDSDENAQPWNETPVEESDLWI